eukprot:m.138308 g.138308  ORF g.138308 m.138308 type:complete len:585 (-) comp14774_c0_seq1:1193-2947(-)
MSSPIDIWLDILYFGPLLFEGTTEEELTQLTNFDNECLADLFDIFGDTDARVTEQTPEDSDDWSQTVRNVFVEIFGTLMNINKPVVDQHFLSKYQEGSHAGDSYQNNRNLEKKISTRKKQLESKLLTIDVGKIRNLKDIKRNVKKEGHVWGTQILNYMGDRLEPTLIDIYQSVVGSKYSKGGQNKKVSSRSPSPGGGGDGNTNGKSASSSPGSWSESPQSHQTKRRSPSQHDNHGGKRSRQQAFNITVIVAELTKYASEKNLRMKDNAMTKLSENVLRCMKEYPDDEEVNTFGCCALRMLEALSQKYNINLLGIAEVLKVIFTTIGNERFQKSIAVQAETWKALRYLLARDSTAKMHRNEICPILSTFMGVPGVFAHHEVQKNMLKCWVSIIKSAENTSKKFSLQDKFKILEHVIKVMQQYPRDEKIQRESCKVAMLFSELIGYKGELNQRDRDELGKGLNEAFKLISKAMTYHTKNNDLQTECCQYFQNLAEFATTQKGMQIRCENLIYSAMYWLSPDDKNYEVCNNALNAVVHSNKQSEPTYEERFTREILPQAKEKFEDSKKLIEDVTKANTTENIYVQRL